MMKFYDVAVLAFKEIKTGRKLIIPAFFTLSLMIAVAIILFNISYGSMDILYSQLDNSFKDGLSVVIKNADFDDIKTIQSLGVKNLVIDSLNSSALNSSIIKIDGKKQLDVQASLFAYWYDKDSSDEMSKLFGITYNDNDSDNIYILCDKEEYKTLGCVSKTELYDKSQKKLCTFNVKKVICSDEYTGVSIYIPFKKTYEAYKTEGVYLNHTVSFIVKPVSEYSSLKQRLLGSGFNVSSEIDKLADNTAMLSVFFKSLSIIITILGIFSFMMMCRMYLKSEQNHIVLQKILGMTSMQIFRVLIVIVETVILLSLLTSAAFVIVGDNYICNVLTEIFGEFNYSSSNTFMSVLAAFIASNAAALVSSIGIYRIISHTDIISLLNTNE